jgi:hypothetical protein
VWGWLQLCALNLLLLAHAVLSNTHTNNSNLPTQPIPAVEPHWYLTPLPCPPPPSSVPPAGLPLRGVVCV